MFRVIENPDWRRGAMSQQPFELEALKRALSYDPDTGYFHWLKPQSPRLVPGDRAGSVGANGRREINVFRHRCFAHQLAWFYHYGEWPTGYVRQKNRDYDDCRIENLVHETPQQAALARALPKSNTSGYRGVSFDKRSGKWQATIRRQYKQMHLGLFDTAEEARDAFAEADLAFQPTATAEEIEEAAKKFGVARRRKSVWALTVRQASGVTGWVDEAAFLAECGDPPGPRYSVVAVDTMRPVGPGNWEWSLPRNAKFDLKTPDGRQQYDRHLRARNPAAFRAHELKRKFNITLAEYQAMHDSQDGKCAICRQPESVTRDGKVKWLAVDHDHESGVIRELLCQSCNIVVGHSRENPEILRAAALYLERHAAPDEGQEQDEAAA